MPSPTLAELPDHATGSVLTVRGEARLRERLVELGFTPGARVRVIARAAFGGPLQVEVRGGTIAVRRDEASCVEVARTESRP